MLHSQTTPRLKKGVLSPSSNFDEFVVTAIGSCRVLAPLKKACSTSGYATNQTGIYGYCHSSTEARQQVNHLQNGTLPPSWLRPIVAPNLMENAPQKVVKPSDLYFVELCSSKILTVDGHAIQLNYLTRHLTEFFKDRERARSYWSMLRLNDRANLLAHLDSDETFKQLTDADQYILSNLQLQQTTPDTLRADIADVRDKLRDVIFVTHFDVRKHDGSLLSARAEYLSMLRLALDDCRAKWFDPSDYVAAFEQSKALEGGKSLSHYSEDFIELLAHNWMTRYIKPNALLSRQAKTSSDHFSGHTPFPQPANAS